MDKLVFSKREFEGLEGKMLVLHTDNNYNKYVRSVTRLHYEYEVNQVEVLVNYLDEEYNYPIEFEQTYDEWYCEQCGDSVCNTINTLTIYGEKFEEYIDDHLDNTMYFDLAKITECLAKNNIFVDFIPNEEE